MSGGHRKVRSGDIENALMDALDAGTSIAKAATALGISRATAESIKNYMSISRADLLGSPRTIARQTAALAQRTAEVAGRPDPFMEPGR